MKKILLPLFVIATIFFVGCGSNEGGSNQQKVANDSTTETATDVEAAGPATPIPTSKESQATAELCACLKPFFADMSPQVREIIVKAGKSSTPMETLTNELQQIKGEAEQAQLFREMEKFENDFQLQGCSEEVKRKYNLDENDSASRQKVLLAAGKNKDCEVIYALLKIGVEQEKRAGAIRR